MHRYNLQNFLLLKVTDTFVQVKYRNKQINDLTCQVLGVRALLLCRIMERSWKLLFQIRQMEEHYWYIAIQKPLFGSRCQEALVSSSASRWVSIEQGNKNSYIENVHCIGITNTNVFYIIPFAIGLFSSWRKWDQSLCFKQLHIASLVWNRI